MSALFPASIKKLLRYWRDTLADEDLMGQHPTDSPVRIDEELARSGKLDGVAVKTLQRAWEENRQKAIRDRTSADLAAGSSTGPVPVVLFMKGFAPEYEHGKTVGDKISGSTHYTLYVPALLSASGSLSFSGDSLPWVGRRFLRPNEEADDIPLLGEVEVFDKWLTNNPLDTATWPELMGWCYSMWLHLTEGHVPPGFVTLSKVPIDINRSVKNAGRNLCQLYDALLNESETPKLLERLSLGNPSYQAAERFRAT